ncbi:MAG: acetyl-CoA carboxylase biotin carboxyl carrier protein [Pirellulales bacterium]|nr:acetyl-CoA carboxylase biotin carboxyl carrier protein [Pirellulales bacterium]
MTGSSSPQDVFDVRKIRRLIELMKEHDLSEIDLSQEGTRIQLRRGASPRAEAAPVAAAPPAPVVARPVAVASELSGGEGLVVIKSPIVGTFYAAPDPESPPYVKIGDHVGPETTVCLIEAMKVFNEIPAEVAGKVVSALVANGEPVEYGQPLFKVDVRE